MRLIHLMQEAEMNPRVELIPKLLIALKWTKEDLSLALKKLSEKGALGTFDELIASEHRLEEALDDKD